MTERMTPGLTLPEKDFRFFDKAIVGAYGKSIEEIAQVEPSFAFQAMRTGLAALFTRRGHRELVQQTETQEGKLETIATTERELDGETAFTGSVSHAMDEVVDRMVTVHESSEEDFVIRVVHSPGLIGRLRKKEPTEEVVAVIPRTTDS